MRMRFLIIVWLCSSWVAVARAGDPVSGDLVGLNVSPAATKQLSVCDQLIAGEEWDAAIDLLEKLQSESPDSLVQSVPGTFLGMKCATQQRLCSLPPAGKAIYRKRVQTTVQDLWQRAIAERDDSALQRIVEEFAASSQAAEATDRLASRSIQRGDLEAALRLWSRLRPANQEGSLYPLPVYHVELADRGPVETKWLVARAMAGLPATDAEREAVTDPRAAEFLDSSDQTPQGTLAPGDLIWTTMATENSPVRHQQRALAVHLRGPQLILNNGSEIRVLHAKAGAPFWPTEQTIDVGSVYQDPNQSEKAPRRRELPCRLAGGVIEQDRYWGVIGDLPRWSARTELVPQSTELFCLDLGSGEGRNLWKVSARELPAAGWQFHGTPHTVLGLTPGDDLVVVPICRPEQQVDLAIAAFRQDDGRLSWWTRIGTGAAEASEPIPETQCVVCGGMVIARSLTGVVTALNARSGTLQWATTELVSSPIVQQGAAAPLLDARAGHVAVADPVRDIVAVLSIDSGELVWAREVVDQIAGVVTANSDRVLVAGRRLQAFSLRDGTMCWEHGCDDALRGSTGVPAITGDRACWPTRTGLWGLNLKDGQIQFYRQLFASPRAVPMQVLVAPNQMLLALPDELAVFDVR